MNIPDQPITMSHQIHTYTELRQQIHDDLRVQHPDWINSDGSAPMCESYESRLMELLGASTRTRIRNVPANSLLPMKPSPR